MSILDRIKDLMSEMSPEEKVKFLEKMKDPQQQHEEVIEEEIPDIIECEEEEIDAVLNARSSIISLKVSYADFCIQSKNKKKEILERIAKEEEFLLNQVAAIKSSKISSKELRDQYMLVLDTDTKTAKLRKNQSFTDE